MNNIDRLAKLVNYNGEDPHTRTTVVIARACQHIEANKCQMAAYDKRIDGLEKTIADLEDQHTADQLAVTAHKESLEAKNDLIEQLRVSKKKLELKATKRSSAMKGKQTEIEKLLGMLVHLARFAGVENAISYSAQVNAHHIEQALKTQAQVAKENSDAALRFKKEIERYQDVNRKRDEFLTDVRSDFLKLRDILGIKTTEYMDYPSMRELIIARVQDMCAPEPAEAPFGDDDLHVGVPEPRSPYDRLIIQRDTGVSMYLDPYDLLKGLDLQNPILDHVIKKAWAPGQRGHKDLIKDLQEIAWSAKEAVKVHQAEEARIAIEKESHELNDHQLEAIETLKDRLRIPRPSFPASKTPGPNGEVVSVEPEWINWSGGECPVEPNTRIRVKYRSSGDQGRPIKRPQNYRWTHTGSYDDIVAYCIL